MFPEEAVKAGDMLHADYVTPVHWGAFVLSDHAWDDSAERFTREYEALHEDVSHLVTPKPGRTLYGGSIPDGPLFADDPAQMAAQRWWREYE